ncbi:MAG: S8 family peptidase [Planctomycetota bacterium]|jgi:hypothetical protein
MSSDIRPDLQRSPRFESCEERLALSAQPLADLLTQALQTQAQGSQFTQTYNQQSIQAVHANYGFQGKGQTIAVIDSGIAWDHYALGGGFGNGAKVVGGWDFAENDANPYDDGGAGFHGTHVSGIIGSEDPNVRGVAPGVDLVSLRVFNDQGAGSMEWVEQALQWVHQNRNRFENPITAVNLSLGSAWNSSTVPGWATLEDEFAQLKTDGIFISVAAGNSFAQYKTAGLAYPAVSSSVVPVASHGASGQLSGFSQREARVLVAPGENIRSTAPDHLFTGGATGQFLGSSGTSMAAPYVAGASALLREAYEFIGQRGVNQDQLYQTFVASADRVFDAVTSAWYNRINLDRAISSVIKDLEGNDWTNSLNLGLLRTNTRFQGTIGRTDDVDTFRFTAAQSGTLTLDFSGSHNLQPLVKMLGSQFQWQGNQLTLQVTAGQQYQFSVETLKGIGHYQVDAKIQPFGNFTNLGTILSNQFGNQQVAGEKVFQLIPGRDGLLSVHGKLQSGAATFAVVDSLGRTMASSQTGGGNFRLDAAVNAGEQVFLKVVGTAAFDLNAANLVQFKDGSLEVHGTNAQDRFELASGEQIEVRVNELVYRFPASQVRNVQLYGHAGYDLLTLNLGAGDETVTLGQGTAQVASSRGWTMFANGLHSITAFSAGGNDRAQLLDSAGDDRLSNDRLLVAMQGPGYANYTVGFQQVEATAGRGNDRADLVGTAGDDRLVAGERYAELHSSLNSITARGFSNLRVSGGAGRDFAQLRDSLASDQFVFGPGAALAQINGTEVQLGDFEQIRANSSGGQDSAWFNDSSGNDQFYQTPGTAGMFGSWFDNQVTGFRSLQARSTSGQDTAQLIDSAGNDTAWMHHDRTVISADLFRTVVEGFQRVNLIANQGGSDTVNLIGTVGTDQLYSDSSGTSMQTAGGALNRVVGAERVTADGWAGNDTSLLVGSEGVERLRSGNGAVLLQRAMEQLTVRNLGKVDFDGRGGADEVVFAQLGQDANLLGNGNRVRLESQNQTIEAVNFGLLSAQSAAPQGANFELQSVDYLFMLEGKWNPK